MPTDTHGPTEHGSAPATAAPQRACWSCGAAILFALTTAGKRIPVDAEPVEGGNLIIEPGPGPTDLPRALVVTAGRGTHRSHFATCPNAVQHRRRR